MLFAVTGKEDNYKTSPGSDTFSKRSGRHSFLAASDQITPQPRNSTDNNRRRMRGAMGQQAALRATSDGNIGGEQYVKSRSCKALGRVRPKISEIY